MKKAVSGIILILLFVGMLLFVFDVQPVKASETIYIRADGSIDPPTANITSTDNVTYHFTDNNYDSIVVETSNIIVDGNGYTLQGSEADDSKGMDLSYVGNVTIKNTEIKAFDYGINQFTPAGVTFSVEWLWLSDNELTVRVAPDSQPLSYDLVRFMIWKISEP